MQVDRLDGRQRLAICVLVGIGVRLALFTTGIPAVLERRPELTSPLTSFRSLQEGLFLSNKGANPYDGGVFYHSPIYLAIFSFIKPSPLVWILSDVVGAVALARIRERRNGESNGYIAAALYLFNPYILLSCLARSTTCLDNTALLLAVASRASGDPVFGGISLALVSHTSLYPILLVAPWLKGTSGLTRALFLTIFTLTSGAIAIANHAIFGSSWVRPTWGTILTVSDLTPNVGMWWYFFTEMFDHFRSFFLGVFQIHTTIYLLPVCLRIEDSLHAMLIMVGIISTWKSYPTLGDLGVWAGLLGCFPEVTQNLRHPLFTLAVYLYTFILLPLLHSLWLVTGTGNANFFYAATMVHGLNSALAVVDVLTAVLRSKIKEVVPWKEEYRAVQFTNVQ